MSKTLTAFCSILSILFVWQMALKPSDSVSPGSKGHVCLQRWKMEVSPFHQRADMPTAHY